MYFAPPAAYDALMKRVPFGKVLTVGAIREYLARENGADFTEPITAGIFVLGILPQPEFYPRPGHCPGHIFESRKPVLLPPSGRSVSSRTGFFSYFT